MPEEVKQKISDYAKPSATNTNVVPNINLNNKNLKRYKKYSKNTNIEYKKSTYRIEGIKIAYLLTVASVADLMQIAISFINLISGNAAVIKDVVDRLISLAKYIPIVGQIIYTSYKAIDISLFMAIFMVKAFVVITIFFITKLIISQMFAHYGVGIEERMGLTKEAFFNAKIFYARKIKLFASILEIIPIWPGIIFGTLITIYTSRVKDKIK